MKLDLPPLERLLDRHNNADDEIRPGETLAELMKRLGLKRWGDEPALTPKMPSMPVQPSVNELAWFAAQFIRKLLVGNSDFENAQLAGIGNTPAELALTENKQELAKLKTRLTRFADKWDPLEADDPVYLEQLERIRAEFEGDSPPPKPKGRRP